MPPGANFYLQIFIKSIPLSLLLFFKAIRRERTFAGNGSGSASLGGHVVAASVDSPPVTVVTVAPPPPVASPAMPKHRYCNDVYGR
jgi:hypothetical protein